MGTIVPNSDIDDWTINLDPGQTITVLLNPVGELVGTVEVLGPDGGTLGSATGTGSDSPVLLQTIPVSDGGVYTIRVGGGDGTTGLYILDLTVNAALEEEAYRGLTNNDRGSAQDIG